MPLKTKQKKSKLGIPVKDLVVPAADPIYTDKAAAAVLNCNLRVSQEKFR